MSGVSPLVSAQDVLSLLDQPHVKLFDVRGAWSAPPRGQPDLYAEGHIPGAVFLDWTAEFIDRDAPISLADVADETGAKASFERLGIDTGDLVILYDDYHGMLAGRIWWALRYWGFENVRVLDGGWSNWVANDLPQSMDERVPSGGGTAEPRRQERLRVSLNAFVASHGAACVIDARGPVNFAGDPDDPRSGHIPGARHAPYRAVLDPDTGCFLDDAALRQVFEDAAPEWRARPIITSCGSGYAATVLLLALAKIGVEATLFDGSISAWKADPDRPMAQGLNAPAPAPHI